MAVSMKTKKNLVKPWAESIEVKNVVFKAENVCKENSSRSEKYNPKKTQQTKILNNMEYIFIRIYSIRKGEYFSDALNNASKDFIPRPIVSLINSFPDWLHTMNWMALRKFILFASKRACYWVCKAKRCTKLIGYLLEKESKPANHRLSGEESKD